MRSSSSFNLAMGMLKRSGVNLVNPGPKQQSKKSTGIEIIEASSDETLENIHRLSKHDQWLAHFNCRSLTAHIDELRLIFQDLYPLFIGITETLLDSSISDAEIEIPGFSVQRFDRKNNRRGGGVAIYLVVLSTLEEKI